MKNNTINRILGFGFSLSLALAAVSCTPDTYDAGSTISASDINISVTQNPSMDNYVYLKNNTPGILPYWDYGVGFSNAQQDTVDIPFAGTRDIVFTAYDKGGTTSVTKQVTVTNNDAQYFSNPIWQLLTGGVAGKTWVFAMDIPRSNYTGYIWGNGGRTNYPQGPNWWGHNADDAVSSGMDTLSEMHFDLNGNYNFSSTENGVTTTGMFKLDLGAQVFNGSNTLSFAEMYLSGATIPFAFSPNDGNKVVYHFHISSITNDELVLGFDTESNDTETWFWRFKRKGFFY